MWKLLFVEDDPASVEPVVAHLKRKSGDYHCEKCDFTGMISKIDEFQPHIIILDLLEDGGTADSKPVGNEKLRHIWEHKFRPIVIYSAQTDVLEKGDWSDNPFVKTVQKGAGSEISVEEAIELFTPHTQALHDSEAFISKTLARSMRDVAPYVFREFSDIDEQKNAILRLARRHLAALMDDLGKADRLASWECYIHPPIGNCLRLGDVLRKKEGDPDDAASFRIVLTPSCDLVSAAGRKAKVDNILVASCIPTKSGIKLMSDMAGMSAPDFLEKIDKLVLSQGFYQKLIPFPILKGMIPSMMANLKSLELLPLKDVAGEGAARFVRIASLDSPFRELISWSYMQTACRLGLPDRDFDQWKKEIKSVYES